MNSNRGCGGGLGGEVICASMTRVKGEEPQHQLEVQPHPHQTQQCYLHQDVKTMFINRNHLYSISPQLNFCPIYESIYGNTAGSGGGGGGGLPDPQMRIEPGEEEEEEEELADEERREHGVPAFYKDIILVKEKKRRKKGRNSTLVFIFIFLLFIFVILAFFFFFFQVIELRKFDKTEEKLSLREDIAGEMRINNKRFEKSLKNKKSSQYLTFSKAFVSQFDIFIKSSPVLFLNYNHSQVIKVRKGENFDLSGIIVEFVIYLKQAASSSSIRTFIQSFLRVLGQHNSYIGKFLVDLRTVKFYGEEEEDEENNENWGPWSEWSTCLNERNECDEDRIKSRRRKSSKREKIEISDCFCEVCTNCKPNEICLSFKGDRARCAAIKTENGDIESNCGGHCTDLDSDERLACRYVADKRLYECYENENVCLESKEWTCADGLCIPLNKRCDGHFNCFDSSDEYNCTCGADEFHCGNKTSCLSADKRCNRFIDCWDGFDEFNCTAQGV